MVDFCLNTCSIGAVPRGNVQLPEQLRAAADGGFSLVGLDIRTIEPYLADGGSAQALRGMLDDLGLHCFELHVTRCAQPGPQHEHREEVRRLAGYAADLGADWINCTVHSPLSTATLDHLTECAGLTTAAGARLSIEFQPEYACASVADAAALIRALDNPDVGVQVDAWHFFRGDSSITQLRGLAASEISFVQFNDGAPDAHATDPRSLPGEGGFDLGSFVGALVAGGFTGVVEVETFAPELMGGDPSASARTQLRANREHWAALAAPADGAGRPSGREDMDMRTDDLRGGARG